MSDQVVAESLQQILHATCRILEVKKDSLHELPKSDQKLVALCGQALTGMLTVEQTHDGLYMVGLIRAFEDSFLENKQLWIDVLVSNQGKILEAFSGGMMNEQSTC
mgnify:CR=1 FL=1|tara:strand:+ start:2120 stop:2437 length:318 start_codon:yes stop_codon:yes gene_type:complete